jgi:hypothetical protein
MKVSQILTGVVAVQIISAVSIPESTALNVVEERRAVPASELVSPDHTLERRKGGGGRGGGSSGGSSGSSGGRSGGGSPGRTSTTSNAGGSTSAGSGRPRSYGGGRYYGGGAVTPYSAGSRTPRGLVPGALILPATMLLIMPGLWLYSTYPYYYNNPYRFYNQSATNNDNDNDNDRRALWTRQTQGANETLPVMCVCQEFSVCGCDENDDQQYINDLVGNGSYAALDKTLVTVSDVNGTKTLVLNGTLENGTTAPGGSDEDSAAINMKVGKYAGYYAVGMMVLTGVFM